MGWRVRSMSRKCNLSARATHPGMAICLLLMGLCWAPGNAAAIDCSGLPTSFSGDQFPTGTFFSNFDNSCYTIAFTTGFGSPGKSGEYADLNSLYNQIYFKVNPSYQLI